MVSADCETTLEIVPASLTGTSKLRPQLPPSWGRNRPSRETFWPRGHLGKRILRAGGWSGSDAARNESGRLRLRSWRSRWAICRILRSFGLSPTASRRRSGESVSSWLASPKARGTSRLNWDRERERTQGRPKHFRTSERPRNSRELNRPKPKMSGRARSILICRKGRSPQRRCLNGSKNRMKPT